MNFIIWNTREENNNCFMRHCKALVSIHKPSMLVLLKTKMTDHSKLTEDLGFNSHTQSAVEGFSGGIIIMWKEDIIKLDNISVMSQCIHAMVKKLAKLPRRLAHRGTLTKYSRQKINLEADESIIIGPTIFGNA
ncbi:hypothetical protein H5410_012892 [Solanum commersonii]|uniref:Uncharacterized protein n=1 Tax=Solanum commersonii TaxID=4109 RepID=A0A9J6ATX3_SOLCO|nr:hypothetical protein H5410_012892 [Solanum commersonii]